MNIWDILILAVIGICLATALAFVLRNMGKGCSGCCDGCPRHCGKNRISSDK